MSATNPQLVEMLQRCVDTLRRYPAEDRLVNEIQSLIGPMRREYYPTTTQPTMFSPPYITVACVHGSDCAVCTHFPQTAVALIYNGSPELNRHIIDLTRNSRKRAFMETRIEDDVEKQLLCYNDTFVEIGDYLLSEPTEGMGTTTNFNMRLIPKATFNRHFNIKA